ncbi:protein TIFY 5A-like [Salvia hispanica]|uniref:protein TIFY 5A-like n=1 Tax=Salvia hispanica TaxID=49212 RepID=UPI002009D45B|nr:protein TIFY 5A-like [Salvia hispanica]
MKRSCNLELRLLTPSVSFHLSDRGGSDVNESPNKTQQLTIFYNGKVASCDATELQARTIISLASGETEGKWSKNSPSAAMNSPVHGAATGMSMKRSLQRFLEKRKTRAQSISPY